MKINKLISHIIFILFTAGIVIVLSTQVNAQEGIIRYLDEKFKEQNIPVTEIEILQDSPLRLQIVVQSADEWTTTDDTIVLNTVDRTVFISARQNRYFVESLVRILEDSQGKQLDYTEIGVDSERIDQILASNTNALALTDENTKALLLEKIHPFLDEYNLKGAPITLDVSSIDNYQTLTLELHTSSLDVADNAAFFFWSLPHFSLFNEVNADGANIALYRAKIKDETGANLLDYMYDFQLGSGGWTKDERLQALGEGTAP